MRQQLQRLQVLLDMESAKVGSAEAEAAALTCRCRSLEKQVKHWLLEEEGGQQ